MLINLPGSWTILLDFAAWFAIHVGVSYATSRASVQSFKPDNWLYREQQWEKGGEIYNSLLRISSWKELLPDGAALFKSGFRKKRLNCLDILYLDKFIRETCRAEVTHWGIFAFAPAFFLWNTWWVGIIMILYALLVNAPCIITQRYNRIRLRRLVARLSSRVDHSPAAIVDR